MSSEPSRPASEPAHQAASGAASEAAAPAGSADLWLFLALTFGLSWAWWVPMALTGATVQPGEAWPTHLPGLLGPAVAAMILVGRRSGWAGLGDLGRRVFDWRVGWRWWTLLGATAALVLMPLAVAAVRSEPMPSGRSFLAYSGAPVPPGALTGLFVLAAVWLVNGVGEELGWRGYLSDQLCRRRSRGVAALLVWVAWAIWHLPMFWVVANFVEMSPTMLAGWGVGLLAGSFVLTWMHPGLAPIGVPGRDVARAVQPVDRDRGGFGHVGCGGLDAGDGGRGVARPASFDLGGASPRAGGPRRVRGTGGPRRARGTGDDPAADHVRLRAHRPWRPGPPAVAHRPPGPEARPRAGAHPGAGRLGQQHRRQHPDRLVLGLGAR